MSLVIPKTVKKRFLNPRALSLFTLALVALLGINVGLVLASTYTISPTTAMTGVPTDFKVGGLTSGTSYNVTIDGSLEFSNLVADSDGYISFSYTFSSSGTYQIAVVDNGTTIATFSVTAYDLINMIMPYFIILIMLGVLVGVLGSFTDIFK